ncbi:AP2-like ethylene-responsive transcription factor AIL5 [Coffea arabica]|uniref:AP2-like ethylene-responsive transcription factor AIL5 n=1 Tax=Coffea arabica TaxID=13443 RepID=A0ABM4UVM1_COFAR
MDSSHPNWLAFSLSNHPLFEAFNSPTSSSGAVIRAEEDNGNNGASVTAAADLSTVLNCSSPKLEDFLGGGSNGSCSSADVCQFGGGNQTSALINADVYDSELKSIAASFLRGYSTEQAESQKQLAAVPLAPEPPAKKAVETFGQRTSIFRGVTRHRWTGRYEAHLWDNTCRREGQSRKGRQVYLGGYDKEEKAARAYDLAALKYWGPTTTTNFPVSNYEKELEEMKHMTRQEFVASLRRKSSGFSRGASIYRGVTRHHQHGRWQARIGRVAGNKDLYLGTFSTQEEAAEAYDIAAIKFRGLNAVTNFDISRYDVKSIASSNLPVGGISNNKSNNNNKTSSDSLSDNKSGDGSNRSDDRDHSSATSVSFVSQPSTSALGFGLPIKQNSPSTSDFWSSLGYHNNNVTAKIPTPTAIPLFQNPSTPNGTTLQCTTPSFNVDYPTNNNNNGYFSGGGYFQQQHQQSNVLGGGGGGGNGNGTGTNSSSPSEQVPFVTRIALGSSNGTGSTYDAANFGNWISPTLHSFQPAKPNLSVFQTPIFGME